MVKENEIVGYMVKKDFDIGKLSEESRIGTIKVNKDIWIKYVGLRHDFEILHQSLIDKIGNKFKVNELLNAETPPK